MQFLINSLTSVMGLVTLVCWILVLIRMFQAGATGPAIASILLVFCLIGPLVAFVYGWMKVDELRVRNIMLLWTACLVATLILSCAGGLLPNQLGLA